jgi:hypothetical protein
MSIELCTGIPPWVATGTGHFKLNQDFLKLPSHMPKELQLLLTDCLQIEPKNRPSFAEIVPRFRIILSSSYGENFEDGGLKKEAQIAAHIETSKSLVPLLDTVSKKAMKLRTI